MPERVVNLSLSGKEVREAILDRIGESLEKDCFLSETKAFDYFSATINIAVRMHDVGRDYEVTQDIGIEVGDEPEGGAAGFEGEIVMEAKPPNEVRVESGQGVPVSTTEDGKPTIKNVKYARPKVKNG